MYRTNLTCPAPLMLDTLEWLRARYGTMSNYLLQCGLSALDQNTLRERLTE
jgi:hypothetical protein